MTGKLKILILLPMIVAESLSVPPPSATNAPNSSGIQKMAKMLNAPSEEIKKMEERTPFKLGKPITAFRTNLFNKILGNELNDDKNVVISPLSIFIALLMVWYASEEGSSTHTQIANALDLNVADRDAYLWNNLQLMTEYNNLATNTLELANGMFMGPEFPINKDYEAIVKGYFLSKVGELPSDRAIAANKINEFVRQKTRDAIKQVLLPNSLTSLTTMILVNAFYFKGMWMCKFDLKNTADMEFNLPGGKSKVTVPMMSQTSKELRIAALDAFGCRVLELPYEDSDLVMYVILPNNNDLSDLNFAMELMDFDFVARELDINTDGITVKLPRLEASWKNDLDEPMKLLGITDMFSDSEANLFEMTKTYLKVGKVLHESTIKVDELGSTTAAATATCFLERKEKTTPEEFIVNIPFGFAIRDTRLGITLSAGRILNPVAGKDNPTI